MTGLMNILPFRKTGKYSQDEMLKMVRAWANEKKFKISKATQIQYGYEEASDYSWLRMENLE